MDTQARWRNRRGAGKVPVAAILLLAAAGCAHHRTAQVTFHDENMDFSLVRTVAVMPFENLTPTQDSAERVRNTVATMLQATGAVYVLPEGEVARGINRTGLNAPQAPSPEEIVSLAKIINADAVFTGTVLEYGEARSGSASSNYITVSLRLIEAQTGKVVWSGASTKGGVSAAERMFGGGGRPMNDVTADAVSDLIDQLFGK